LFFSALVPLKSWKLTVFLFFFDAGNEAAVGGCFLLAGDGGLFMKPSASFCFARQAALAWICVTKPPWLRQKKLQKGHLIACVCLWW